MTTPLSSEKIKKAPLLSKPKFVSVSRVIDSHATVLAAHDLKSWDMVLIAEAKEIDWIRDVMLGSSVETHAYHLSRKV